MRKSLSKSKKKVLYIPDEIENSDLPLDDAILVASLVSALQNINSGGYHETQSNRNYNCSIFLHREAIRGSLLVTNHPTVENLRAQRTCLNRRSETPKQICYVIENDVIIFVMRSNIPVLKLITFHKKVFNRKKPHSQNIPFNASSFSDKCFPRDKVTIKYKLMLK